MRARATLLRRIFLSATLGFLALAPTAEAQSDPPIPTGKIRIHYFRPDGNYFGWTLYAFGDTTENTGDFGGGPVKVTGQNSFGAYFDVGVTPTAQDVGISRIPVQMNTFILSLKATNTGSSRAAMF